MKKHCTPLNAADSKPKTLVLAVKKALPYLVALSLGAAVVSPAVGRSGDSAAAFTATQLIRQFTLKNTVAQVNLGMQGSVQEVNGVLRALGMGGAPSGYPVDMGSVPSSANLPQRDGAGRPLGYCAWDNSTSTSNTSFLGGLGTPSPLVYAVVSPGLNGSMETSCAHILSTRTGLGDDYVQVTAPSQTSSRQFRSAVGTYADLAGMPADEGDIRLVLENNRLYSYVGGAWQPVDGSRFSDDSASSDAGAISYTTGKVTVADFQASTAAITGALSGSSATFSGAVTANSFLGNGAALTDLNASNISSGVLGAAFGGTGVDGSAAAAGSLLIGTGAGYALGSITAGEGIGVLNGAGSITISNTGVLSIAGTSNQITASAANGDVVLSLPQDIATTSIPTFGGLVLNGQLSGVSAIFSGPLTSSRLNVGTNDGVTDVNTIIGIDAMPGVQAGGGGNVAIGYSALQNNASGELNTAVGTQVLQSNTTGTRLSAFGFNALRSNTTGYENSAFGTWALLRNTSGFANSAFGKQALFANVSGSHNVAIGSRAGYSTQAEDTTNANVSGSNNTFLGSYALPGVATPLNFATAIGSGALVGTSNTLVLGRTTDTTVIGATGTATSGILQNKILQVTGDVGITGALTIGGVFTATGFVGNGSSLTDLNADNIATGTLAVARGGTGVDGSAAANGTLLIGNGSGYTLNTLTAGAGVSVTNGAGSITITNTGVTQFNGRTGNVTFAQSDLLGVIESSDGLNISIGSFAAPTTAGGDDNVAIGRYSQAQRGGLGVNNTSVGASALRYLVSGSANSAFGAYSLNNTTGSRNSALGNSALRNLIGGDDNTAIGTEAASSQTSGSRNVVLGRSSGVNLTTGNSNTFLGTNSGLADATQQNFATAIGADAQVSSSNTIVLGRTTDTTVIGSTSDDGSGNRLQVTGNAGFSGNVELGSISVLGVPAQLAFRYASDTGSAFYVQPNLGLGLGALSSRKSAGNVAIGDGVLGQMNTLGYGDESGTWNTGVGYQALYNNDFGDENTAIGYKSLYANVSGYYNTAIGSTAMESNTSGFNNTAVGYHSMHMNTGGRDNASFGYTTLHDNATGWGNAAFGSSAMYSTTGSENTSVGTSSLSQNVTGNRNSAFGFDADVFNGGLNYASAMGADSRVGTSNTIVLGAVAANKNSAYSTVDDQIVIGATSRNDTYSNTKLYVNGAALFSRQIAATGGALVSSNQYLRFGEPTETFDPMAIYRTNAAADRSRLRIGIGDNPSTFGGVNADELQVGLLGLDLVSYTPVFRIAGSGDVIANGYVQATAFYTSSDHRLKTNIQAQNSDSVLSRLEQLQTYSYEYLANPNLGRRIGVIAQEIQNLFPEAVATRADGMLSVDYSALGAMAAMGVGQLSMEVKVLDKTLEEQGQRITALDDRVNLHDTRINSLEGWKTEAVKRMEGMQNAIDLNIQKIAENAVAIQTNTAAIERLDDTLFTLDGQVKNNSDLINNINSRWAQNFSESADGSQLTVNAAELMVSNFTAQQVRANSVYSQRLEAEMARIADLEVNNLRANSAVANRVQAEQVNTGSTQVYAGVGLPAILFAAKSDGHYTVNTSALDGSYATATVIVNAGQAKVVSVASEGIELYAEGNVVKALAAGKSIKASWIKMG